MDPGQYQPLRSRPRGGAPLPEEVRRRAQEVFGHDFFDVRLFVGPQARRLGARAFTMGTSIFLDPEEHAPGTVRWLRLLGHELAHVVQQRTGRVRNPHGYGVSMVQDAVLEADADRMAQIFLQAVTRQAPPFRGTIQRMEPASRFPDAYNHARKLGTFQLDHMISQDTLKKFSATWELLLKLLHNKDQWAHTRSAIEKLLKTAPTFPEWKNQVEHISMSLGYLLNLPWNIVPGPTSQGQPQGIRFDPQITPVALVDKKLTWYDQTSLSKDLFQVEQEMRDLCYLTPPSNLKLPEYVPDEEVDGLFAEKLEKIAQHFSIIGPKQIPEFNKDSWYVYGKSIIIKRRAAEWIDVSAAMKIVSNEYVSNEYNEYNIDFEFDVTVLRYQELVNGNKIKKFVEKKSRKISVKVLVDVKSWKHIYERHYLSTFKYEIEAVNTFWKKDPYEYLCSEEGKRLLTDELRLVLQSLKNFSRSTRELEDEDEDLGSIPLSFSVNKLFFQGHMTYSYIEEKEGEGRYEVEMDLTSIAPNDPELAWAILPNQLASWVPATRP
jgi:hypothetical protein